MAKYFFLAEKVSVSTTRPETILGDTAIMVHPDDPRYFHLHGETAIQPFSGKTIPIITDHEVNPKLGTGRIFCMICSMQNAISY